MKNEEIIRKTKPKNIGEFLQRLTLKEQEFLWEHIAKIRELDKEEKNPADGANKKFHKGDWIVNSNGLFRQIEKVDNHGYQTNGGWLTHSEYEKRFHIWSIDDANDGDVLVSNGKYPFIFKETMPSSIKTNIENPLTVIGYCGIGGAGFTNGGGWGDTANCIYYPATKEQRELLFQKMKEAGYVWVNEKKELKKI